MVLSSCLRLETFPIVARLAVRITVRWNEQTGVCEYVRTCVCEYAHHSPLGKKKILRMGRQALIS